MLLLNCNRLLLIAGYCTLVSILYACHSRSEQAKEPPQNTLSTVYYQAPDTVNLGNDEFSLSVKYGAKLIANTAYYIGPEGIVSKNLGNKMNCINCHLAGGTKAHALNFFNTHKIYPQYRSREDQILSLSQRVNNCVERPHSGKPLHLESKEMIAIISYIKWIGEGYNPDKHKGYGLKEIDFKGLQANSERGKIIYEQHCSSCHQSNGMGLMNANGITYVYPPLWGKDAYQEASSMHRVLKAASFIKYNMPYGMASVDKPVLTDQQALDVAAYINDGRIHTRPKATGLCYPDIEKKPIDYFQGPYVDQFSEQQHAFGPWDDIINFYQNQKSKR